MEDYIYIREVIVITCQVYVQDGMRAPDVDTDISGLNTEIKE